MDSLWGSITPERAWWELGYYHLDMQVFPDKKFISGTNTLRFTVIDSVQEMQIDLQAPMKLKDAVFAGESLPIRYLKDFHYINIPDSLVIGNVYEIILIYEGHPHESKNPPWSGGVTWEKDRNRNDFIATTCQGDGASIWWPCRDHPADEPDSVLISVRVPEHLMNISNGRLQEVTSHNDGTRTYHWYVSNPINQYGININIGDYVHFGETYECLDGPLDCDYYVLRYNLEKAQEQFK
jgi:aminopeptidase N